MHNRHRQQLTWRWLRTIGMPHQVHRQIRHVHQCQSVLGTQPAQELNRPHLLAMLLQPDLLPVSLVLSTDLDRLPQGILQFIQQLPQPDRTLCLSTVA